MDVHHLYEQWHGRVLSVAQSFLPEAEAEEVVQEVFLQVWRRVAEYDPSRASAWTWIHAIARSRCLDRLRATRVRNRVHLRAAEVAECGMPDEGWESRDQLDEVLRRLAPRQREVVELAYFSGLSHREIAFRTGDPLGTVKTRLRMALGVLRQGLPPRASIKVAAGVSPRG
jgi:RNA polymerase sigma-70 factor (ECF subfamily)